MKIGAYVLPGDLTWLAETLPAYYPYVDELVVPYPADGLGWSGQPVPAASCLEAVRRVDGRGILRVVPGTWRDVVDPLRGETAQRQAALDAFSPDVGWVLQLDGDELLPRPQALLDALRVADTRRCDAVEWPMRVLYRRTHRGYLEVATTAGTPAYEYPGPVAVRRTTPLASARRTAGPRLRVLVAGDTSSPAVLRAPEPGEERVVAAAPDDAIVHNSWARTLRQVRAKVRGWGHARDFSARRYLWLVWWPSPLTWRAQRDLHPLFGAVWPRLRHVPVPTASARPPSRRWHHAEAGHLVVVLSWNGRRDTMRCVESLVHGSPEVDVLVVDNGSGDGVLEAVRARWPHVATLQTGDNLGFAGGMNRGLAWGIAHGYAILTVLNNDTVVDPGTLERLALLAASRDVAASPRIVWLDDERAADAGTTETRLWFAGGVLDARDGLPRHLSPAEAQAALAANEPFATDLLTGCCVCARTDTWRAVGFFDARFFLDFEDSDWSLRARRQGVRLVVDPRAVVRHRVSASFTGPASYLGTFYYARNALLFAARWRRDGVRPLRLLRHRVLPQPVRAWRDHGPGQGLRTAVVVAAALAAGVTGVYGRAPRPLESLAATWAAASRRTTAGTGWAASENGWNTARPRVK